MRLLIVSNRLPITTIKREGKIIFQDSAGGLVSGLRAYLDSLKNSSFAKAEYIWIGWPGIAIKGKMKERLRKKLLTKSNAYPVFYLRKNHGKILLWILQ